MKNKSFKIIISLEGTITSVYSDIMDLQRIGNPFINRATEVFFNNRQGYWVVLGVAPYFYGHVLLQNGFINRADAIEWEIRYLNKHLGEIIEAYSKGGYIPRKANIFERKNCQIQEKVI